MPFKVIFFFKVDTCRDIVVETLLLFIKHNELAMVTNIFLSKKRSKLFCIEFTLDLENHNFELYLS